MKFDSIRWRLVLSYVLLTVLIVSLVGVLTLTLLGEYVRAQATAQLSANASAIAQQARPLLVPVPRVGELENLASSLSFLGNFRVRILDEHGNVLVDSGMPGSSTSVVWVQPEPGQVDRPPLLMPLFSRQRGQPFPRSNPGSRGSIIVRIEEGPWGRHVVFESVTGAQLAGTQAAPAPAQSEQSAAAAQPGSEGRVTASVRYPIGSQQNPDGYIQLDSLAAGGAQILATIRRALLLAGLGASLIAVIAGLLVSRGLTAPLLALEKSAGQMSSGDLSTRAPVNGAGEIGRLARQFNQMAERLQISFAALSAERDALRRFISDASHELRTPVTALGNFIELLQGPAANDSQAREEFLAESQEQIRRMDWITSNLLDLSRLDAGLIQLDRQPVEVSELLQAAAAPFQVKARQKEIRLVVQTPPVPALFNCDRMRMEMAIGNLLDNAIKFTPPGGQVKLTGQVQDQQSLMIQVEDTGKGILPEDLPRIFDRFYRGHAPDHASQESGSGLGLAIVQSIVQAHGGQAAAESQVEHGSRFTLYFKLGT